MTNNGSLIERITADPTNPWAWYELWKVIGLTELPPAAMQGLEEFSGEKALIKFIRTHCMELNGRNVDLPAIIMMLAPVNGDPER